MASSDMPDHWHMLIDFASFGDQIIFSDGDPSIFVSCFRPGRWEIGTRIAEDYDGFDMHAELERVLGLPFILEGPSFAVSTTWDDLTADD